MLTTITLPENATPAECAREVARAWDAATVIHLKGLRPQGDLREYYTAFFEMIGEPARLAEDATKARDAQRTGEVWFEVRYEPSIPDAYRHSANPQPLHTDGSYIPGFPNAGFLACQAMPAEGGATIFIDADTLVSVMQKEAPALLEKLQTVPMPHARSGDARTETVVRFENGEPLVNWNYFCVDRNAPDQAKALREEFFAYHESSKALAPHIERVKLSPGEAVLWKDDRVLHGRDGFDADQPSERFLWKAALSVQEAKQKKAAA